MDFSLELQQKLSLLLSPRMILLRSILQMDAPELEQYVRDAALDNPLLELEEIPAPEFFSRKTEWERSEQGGQSDPAAFREYTDPLLFAAAPDPAGVQTHLRAAAELTPLPPRSRAVLSALISYIETDGRLETPLEQIALSTGFSEDELEQGLRLLQRMDPVGIGARSLAECLSIQLEVFAPEDRLAQKLVKEHLTELSDGQFAALAKKLHVSRAAVEERFSLIQTLDPFPASIYEQLPPAHYVREDLIAREENGRFEVRLQEDLSSRLSLDPQYQAMISTVTGETQKWLLDRQQEAIQLRESILTRNQLLLICAYYLLDHQPEYARDRSAPLRPLTLSQASAELGLHLSVLSRLVSGKYIRIGSELVPLRSFFSREVSGSAGGVTSSLVKKQLRRILEEESPSAPLTDQQLCQALERQGMRLSRRTVAKYRSELGIPPAGKRRSDG